MQMYPLTVVSFLLCIIFCKGNGEFKVMTVAEQIKSEGYPVEIHPIVTEDGYMLNLFRIPHGLVVSKDEPKNKSAILLVHGMGGSPHNYLALGKKKAAAFYFADRGFDVWLFCARGVECMNPKKHKIYDWNKHPQYWNYSFHDIGAYDQPAAIDCILNVTGQEKIFFIGYSAGGPQFYVMVSEKPEYNNKVKINVPYASGYLLKHTDYPVLQVACGLTDVLKGIVKMLNLHELYPPPIYDEILSFTRTACNDKNYKTICKYGMWSFGTHRSTQIDEAIVPNAVSYIERLASKQLFHFMENLDHGDFRKYNYGKKKNKLIYGQEKPPLYNLSACTVPNAFFYGATDTINTKQDVWEAQETLSNTILDYEVGPRFMHLDFVFGKDADKLVYEPTAKLFKDFDAGKIPPKVTRRKRTEQYY